MSVDATAIFRANGTNCEYVQQSGDIVHSCDYLHRLVLALKFYQKCRNGVLNKESLLLLFNDKYGVQLLDDIKHYKLNHCQTNKEIQLLKDELLDTHNFSECLISTCLFSSRHFNRSCSNINDDNKGIDSDSEFDFYSLQLDNLHFNLFHLIETGYRYLSDTEYNDDIMIVYQEDDNNHFEEYLRMSRFVRESRNRFNMNRFTSSTNKYNINQSIIGNNQNDNDLQITFMDKIIDYIDNELSDLIDSYQRNLKIWSISHQIMLKYFDDININELPNYKKEVVKLMQYLGSEEFDSDSVMMDTANLIMDKHIKQHSNICNFLHSQTPLNYNKLFNAFKQFIIRYNC